MNAIRAFSVDLDFQRKTLESEQIFVIPIETVSACLLFCNTESDK